MSTPWKFINPKYVEAKVLHDGVRQLTMSTTSASPEVRSLLQRLRYVLDAYEAQLGLLTRARVARALGYPVDLPELGKMRAELHALVDALPTLESLTALEALKKESGT